MYLSVLKFIVKKRTVRIFAVLFIVIIITCVVQPWIGEPNITWWSWLEPISGIATLAVAVLVWLGEVVQDEENYLPKRLTVRFHLEGKEIMVCEKVYLAGEGDIRAWGQQLGGQMAENPYLHFEPSLDQMPGRRDKDDTTSETIKLYEVVFHLTESPIKKDIHGKVFNQEVINNIEKGKKCIWKYNAVEKRFSKNWE